MKNTETNKISTREIVLCAIMTALVVILQFMGSFVHFGPFSISLVLIPIVIGTATCGAWAGVWLGLVFGAVVLASGDASAFLAVNAPGAVITVLAKGILCGYLAGLVYKMLEGYNRYVAVAAAAVVCPVVNTGVFLLGCMAFFMDTVAGWAAAAGFEGNIAKYMVFGLVGANFLFEFGLDIILSPAIVRLLNIRNKQR